MPSPDLEQVRALWRELTDAPDGFTASELLVVGSDGHRAAPPGWIGIVELRGDVVVACPTMEADRVRRLLSGSASGDVIRPSFVDAVLQPVDTLGPALLFYGRASTTMPPTRARAEVVGPLEVDDRRVRSVVEDASPSERDEAAIEATTSGIYLGLAPDGNPAAACAWRVWPHRIAHISVLSAARYRGAGLGAATASVALEAATDAGFLPQWRAARANAASIALARHLGLDLIGHQYSLRLA